MSDIETTVMNAEEARAATDRVRDVLTVAWETVAELYRRRGWEALGYGTWQEYCDAEFGTRLNLPREERQEITATLRKAGMSTRAVGSALGVGVGTVHRDEEAGVPNGTPHDPSVTGSNTESHTVGMDGKVYEPSKPAPEPELPDRQDEADQAVADFDRQAEAQAEGKGESSQPMPEKKKRKPLPQAFQEATHELDKSAQKLARLADDERFTRYAQQIATMCYGDLLRVLETVHSVHDRLPNHTEEDT